MSKEVELSHHLTLCIKDAIRTEHANDFKEYKDGLDYFKENCIQQGISLQHDPDHLKPPPKSNFNINTAMMKIREKTHTNMLARKDKAKRFPFLLTN